MCCRLAAMCLRRHESSSRSTMAPSVYEQLPDMMFTNKCKLQLPVSIQKPG